MMKSAILLYMVLFLVSCKNSNEKATSHLEVSQNQKEKSLSAEQTENNRLDNVEILNSTLDQDTIIQSDSVDSNHIDAIKPEAKKIVSKTEEKQMLQTKSDSRNDDPMHPSKGILDSIKFAEDYLDYDTIYAGDLIKHKFHFTNHNKIPIEVESTYPDCGCTVPSFPFLPIQPKESGFIGITYNSVGKVGEQKSKIRIKFKGIRDEKTLFLKGVVLDTSRSSLDVLTK